MKKLAIFSAVAILTSLIPSAGFAANRELPNSIERAVGKLEAHEDLTFDETSLITYGSAAFVDHGGCFFTNSHVVVDLYSEDHGLYPKFRMLITEERGAEPEEAFEAEILFVDEEVDLAYGCPRYEDTRVFTNFFPRYKEDQFYTRSYGEELWLAGYPLDGQQSITVAPGHIVGFLEQPDISAFAGLPNVNQDRLRLYKADALAGAGISGGVAFTSDLHLAALPFAGSFHSGGFVFLLGEQMYIEFEQDVYTELAVAGCVFDWESGYYLSGGGKFYDQQCAYALDELLEQELQQSYQVLCGDHMQVNQLVPAVRRAKELNDVTPWTELILDQCQGRGSLAQQSGDFAYGKERLSSLAEEQNLAVELKAEIDKEYPDLKIHEDDWSTIVNSYIYGGYPVSAINRAIELGGYTVHPEIPFSEWNQSKDYQQWM